MRNQLYYILTTYYLILCYIRKGYRKRLIWKPAPSCPDLITVNSNTTLYLIIGNELILDLKELFY